MSEVLQLPIRTIEAMEDHMLDVEAEIWGGLCEYVNSGVNPDWLAAILTRAAHELLFLECEEE